MRIVGHIEHPILKITIFQMSNRFSVKFENANYEQTFKIRQLETLAAVQELIDADFINRVEKRFQTMHHDLGLALEKVAPPVDHDEFDELI